MYGKSCSVNTAADCYREVSSTMYCTHVSYNVHKLTKFPGKCFHCMKHVYTLSKTCVQYIVCMPETCVQYIA